MQSTKRHPHTYESLKKAGEKRKVGAWSLGTIPKPRHNSWVQKDDRGWGYERTDRPKKIEDALLANGRKRKEKPTGKKSMSRDEIEALKGDRDQARPKEKDVS